MWLIFLLAIALAFILWMDRRGQKAWEKRNNSKLPPPVLQASAATPMRLPATNVIEHKSAEDALAESMQAYRSEVRKRAEAENAALQNEVEAAERRIKEATALADKLGVSYSIVRIADSVRHWHAWSKNPTWRKDEYDVKGFEYNGGDEVTIDGKRGTYHDFVRAGNYYRIWQKDFYFGYESTTQYCTIILEQYDGEKMNTLMVCEAKDAAIEYDDWRPYRVTFLTVGDWIKEMIEFDELLTAKQAARMLAMSAEHLLPKAVGVTGNV